MPTKLGSTPTDRELQIFHSWLAAGRATDAGKQLGTTQANVGDGLKRLCGRFGVRHSIQLVRPLIMSPLYARIRRLERENRRLKRLVRETYGTYEPDSTRVSDGGIGTRRHKRRWRKARQTAIREGLIR